MKYPAHRSRRLRQTENLRRLIRQTHLSVDDLIVPYFVIEGKDRRKPISAMPGAYRLSLDNLIKEISVLKRLRIPAILLFGVPGKKDGLGAGAYDEEGITQSAVRAIKKNASDLVVITDVCLCAYTTHGHCGLVREGDVDNDATLEILSRVAISHAKAGADMVAPSGMIDGQVKAIREALDTEGFSHVGIMAYSAKYASSFYGPFREAMDSTPKFGDRRSYQMDPSNLDEALREIKLDIEEGADIVMVKPALVFLDVISRARGQFNFPIAAYNVSGEYSLVKAAAKSGWVDERKVVLEILTSIKRAGADMIITYHAKDVAKWLRVDSV